MIRTLIHDVDNCLVDWRSAFTRFLCEAKGYNLTGGLDYDLRCLFHEAPPDIAALIGEFNRSPAFRSLPAMDGALDALADIRRRFPALRHVAVTCTGTHPETVVMRQIQAAEFGIADTHILPLDADKSPYFRAHGPAIVIEDNPTGLRQAEAAGCIPIAIGHPYNASHSGLRATRWAEVPDLIARILDADLAAA